MLSAQGRWDAGLQVVLEGDDKPVRLSHSVLEGHRICAVKDGIKKGEPLLSWGTSLWLCYQRHSNQVYIFLKLFKYQTYIYFS